MPLNIEWGNENKTFIYSRFTPDWTWDDFYANTETYVEMLKSVNHRVDFVGDFTDAALLPTRLFENTKQMHNDRLDNEGYIILMNTGRVIQTMYDAILLVLPVIKHYVIFVPDLPTAREVVNSGREMESLNS